MDPDQLRVASPSMLIVAAIMFCLPWVNVRCRTPDGEVRISQTGAQAALGKTTVSIRGPDGQVLSREVPFPRRPGLGGGGGGGGLDHLESPADTTDAAPLLWLYALALLGGAGAGFALPDDRPRMLAVAACGAAAGVVLLLQLATGFPLISSIPPEVPFETSYSLWMWASLLVTFAVPAVALAESIARRGPAAPAWPDDDADWYRP